LVVGKGFGLVEDQGGLRILRVLGRDMARASAWKLVGVNEESSVWITGVQGEHSVVDKLLGALGLVARGKESAGTVREQASLQPGGLGVVVVTVSITIRNVLEDDSPVTLNIDSSGDLGVVNVAWAEISLGSDPVAGVVFAWSFASSGVVVVVKVFLLRFGNSVDKIISALVSNVSVLLQEESVLADLGGHVIGGVFLVHHAVGKVGALGTLGWGLRVTVTVAMGSRLSMAIGSWRIGGGVVRASSMVDRAMMRKLVCPYQCRD